MTFRNDRLILLIAFLFIAFYLTYFLLTKGVNVCNQVIISFFYILLEYQYECTKNQRWHVLSIIFWMITLINIRFTPSNIQMIRVCNFFEIYRMPHSINAEWTLICISLILSPLERSWAIAGLRFAICTLGWQDRKYRQNRYYRSSSPVITTPTQQL